MGQIGLERCLIYLKHKLNDCEYQRLIKALLGDCNEKLFNSKDKFFRTPMGFEMTVAKHNEFMAGITQLTIITDNTFDLIS